MSLSTPHRDVGGAAMLSIGDFWKDDFAPLESAGRAVLQAMREDEAAPDADLYRRISAAGEMSHLYFKSDLPSTMALEHARTVPLPELLQQHLVTAKATTKLGLFVRASLAWMSVDDKVFLWSFNSPGSFCVFQVHSHQYIVSVGLVRPKKGVFKPSVEWCLVIATSEEVILCALVRPSRNGGTPRGIVPPDENYHLVPTTFTLSTDGMRIVTITGTESGRIFLGGDDGCLYEMIYHGFAEVDSNVAPSIEERLEKFYDEGIDAPSILIDDTHTLPTKILHAGKRTFLGAISAVAPSEPSSHGPRKCRKLNRTSTPGSWIGSVLPDIVLKAGSFLFGSGLPTGGSKIVNMQVDEDRQCLYTLGENGWICSFRLHQEGEIESCAVMQTPTAVSLYLNAVARGQLLPPKSSGSVGSISFLGSGGAALAGVGGTEGARALIKAAELRVKTNGKSAGAEDIFKPVSIHVVPPTESSRITILAVTTCGLRLHLSSLSSNVLSSGPTSMSQGWGNPLAPSKKLTLCHIRSPPPLSMGRHGDLSAVSAIKGGLKPSVGDYAASIRVDSSLYKDGVFIAAIENKNSRSREMSQREGGDMIIAVCPDSVAREAEGSELGKDDKSKNALIVPGGVAETSSNPMATAYGVSDGDKNPILPGGYVWDVAAAINNASAVRKLITSSQTPQDKELDLGLTPAYIPPLKLHAKGSITMNGNMPGTNGTAIVLRSSESVLAGSALMTILNLFSLSPKKKPVNEAIPADASYPRSTAHHERSYRVSKRFGVEGFSKSAMESNAYSNKNRGSRSPSKASRTSKSARLRPWLLQPATVPLNQISLQHLEQSREYVVLNAGGLHVFSMKSILDMLASTLLAAGENVANDSTVTSFFDGYSYKEGCALCLSLAIGCGPGVGNEVIQRRALRAAMARASQPRLMAFSDQSSTWKTVVNTAAVSSDPLVPSGYNFTSSDLCQGLTALVSRLLRPIWHKPAVVVTEGRTVKTFSNRTVTTPAKVEILLDGATLEDIRVPIRSLLGAMRIAFPPAVVSVPGAPERSDRMMDIEDENGGGQDFTRSLQYQSQLRAANDAAANHLSHADAEKLARLIEEKNIHSLYRLLGRVVQLLNLMSLLHRVQRMGELNEVDWGLLHGLTFCQLVRTADGQDRIESLLNDLVIGSASDNATVAMKSKQPDQLSDMLAKQCYYFFSPGSRSAYLGLRCAAEALALPYGSADRAKLATRACDHFESAAKHWHSASLITGRILHSSGPEESYNIKATRALESGSPLANVANKLIRLENVANAVKICLLTASNFKTRADSRESSLVNLQPNVDSFSWEHQLYHKRRDQDYPDNVSTSPRSSASSPHIVAHGASVTSEDAIQTCYATIFHHLSLLLKSKKELGYSMVSACAASTDNTFRNAFFLFLLDSNNTDVLLLIDSPDLEKWLLERHDPDLLLRYYTTHKRYYEAGILSWERANDANQKLTLRERISCLGKAYGSFDNALNNGGNAFISLEEIKSKKDEVTETLAIAQIQNRMHQKITEDSWDSDLGKTVIAEKKDRLANTLVPVSDLYNDYANVFCLFDYCLRILHACRRDEKDEIRNLWKNIICAAILPCATRHRSVFDRLQVFVSDVDLGDSVKLLSESQGAESLILFESGEWKRPLEDKIVYVGAELFGSGADYVVPLFYLLSLLEELRGCVKQAIEPEWSLMTLCKVGFPYMQLLEAYDAYFQDADRQYIGGADLNNRIEYFSSVVNLLEHWVGSAQKFTHGSLVTSARQQLNSEVSSGNLHRKMNILNAGLETMPDSSRLRDLREQLNRIEEQIRAVI